MSETVTPVGTVSITQIRDLTISQLDRGMNLGFTIPENNCKFFVLLLELIKASGTQDGNLLTDFFNEFPSEARELAFERVFGYSWRYTFVRLAPWVDLSQKIFLLKVCVDHGMVDDAVVIWRMPDVKRPTLEEMKTLGLKAATNERPWIVDLARQFELPDEQVTELGQFLSDVDDDAQIPF